MCILDVREWLFLTQLRTIGKLHQVDKSYNIVIVHLQYEVNVKVAVLVNPH